MIQPTLSLVWFIPAAAIALWSTRGWILPIAVGSSVFQAVALIEVQLGAQGNGLAPAYLLLPAAFVQELLRSSGKEPRLSLLSICLVLFVSYALLSSVLAPMIFPDAQIFTARTGLVDLSWTPSFLTQSVYLLLCTGLFFAVRALPPERAEKLLDWVLGACALSALIGLYQFAAIHAGLPFPSDLLYTNKTYTLFDAYDLHRRWGSDVRINATFAEPSFAAVPYSGALALLSARVLSGNYRLWHGAAAVLILIGILLAASSTGMVCLALIGSFVLFRFFSGSRERAFNAPRMLILAGASLLALIVMMTPSIRSAVEQSIQSTLIDKSASGSYEERSEWNRAALETFRQTYYLGAGWGSSRASSFGATLLANAGLIGAFLFTAFAAGTLWLAYVRDRTGRWVSDVGLLEGISVTLVAHLLAVPDIVFPILWVYMGLASRAIDPVEPFRSRDVLRPVAA
jgi:hypothetical protein